MPTPHVEAASQRRQGAAARGVNRAGYVSPERRDCDQRRSGPAVAGQGDLQMARPWYPQLEAFDRARLADAEEFHGAIPPYQQQ
jgi:hypothetical protein